MLADHELAGQRGDNAFRDEPRLLRAAEVREHHREFVPPEPRERIARADAQLYARRRLAQDRVAGGVAVDVVHVLEVVEVDEQQREGEALALAADHLQLEAVREEQAVGRPGHPVEMRLDVDLLVAPRGRDGDRHAVGQLARALALLVGGGARDAVADHDRAAHIAAPCDRLHESALHAVLARVGEVSGGRDAFGDLHPFGALGAVQPRPVLARDRVTAHVGRVVALAEEIGARMVVVVVVVERDAHAVGAGHFREAQQHRAYHLRRVLRGEDEAVDLRERLQRRELPAQHERHLVEGEREGAELVLAREVQARGEIVGGDTAGALGEALHGLGDVARLADGEPGHQQQRQQHHRYEEPAELRRARLVVALRLRRDDDPVGSAEAGAHELGPRARAIGLGVAHPALLAPERAGHRRRAVHRRLPALLHHAEVGGVGQLIGEAPEEIRAHLRHDVGSGAGSVGAEELQARPRGAAGDLHHRLARAQPLDRLALERPEVRLAHERHATPDGIHHPERGEGAALQGAWVGRGPLAARGDGELVRQLQPLEERHRVGLGGRLEPLLALLLQQRAHLEEREQRNGGERQERAQHEEHEQPPRDARAYVPAQRPDHGSNSWAVPMKPPSRARTMSSRLFLLESCAAVRPSRPTL